jgi:hypothetical protein
VSASCVADVITLGRATRVSCSTVSVIPALAVFRWVYFSTFWLSTQRSNYDDHSLADNQQRGSVLIGDNATDALCQQVATFHYGL